MGVRATARGNAAALPRAQEPCLMRPEFVDNQAGNTLESALIGLLCELKSTLRDPVDLAVATGYFNPEGFGRIAEALEGAGQVRLLLGAEPVPPPARPV